ncbi:c40af038-2292-4be3-a2f3-cb5a643b4e80 [Thermothielavioides terrestris]|uniref:C40af038-2292-4be3-a2f3-cb5a643b4e80 n=1 Tax=Thermothielavioides terrestris TaxID=2587410 RepID=A0A3S4BBD5_9PEZI|nr:c40af038-2292-4be3-a2f3-cb5a643b4e80 [Thermothielavioides terrestris]
MTITEYDELAEAAADAECRAWIRRLIDSADEVVAFVDARLNGGGTGTYKGFFKGAFNISYHVDFNGRRPSALIRFAMPGETVTPWRDEKVANEARFIEYLRENTTIPLPRIHCWGPASESPRGLGPFIIMDYIEGERLSWFLKRPKEDEYEPMVLNPDLDEATLDTFYEQIAGYMLQLSRLSFPRIGAISRNDPAKPGAWAVTERPLTFNMNILGTTTGYPIDKFPTKPLDSSSEFFEQVAQQHLLHLETQRNLADDEEDVQRRFVARHRFRQLIPRFCTDNEHSAPAQFKIFCDDLQPNNMLFDRETLRITAVLDFEFTNAMPEQFAYDPPWWLVLKQPGLWIEEDGMDDFLARYEPRLEQFLRVMERVEAQQPGLDPPLSARMRESWESKRFWFNYASRRCLDLDAVYWAALHDPSDGDGLALLDAEAREKLPALVEKKMEQLRAYKAEHAAQFSKEDE